MTKYQEIMCLSKLEEDIIQYGKIGLLYEDQPFVSKRDLERLKRFKFCEIQDKYNYGWYIETESLDEQIKSIEKFKLHIMDNYKEDQGGF